MEVKVIQITEELGMEAYAPYSGTEWDLTNHVCLKETQGVPVKKKEEGGSLQTEGGKRASAAYSRLLEAARMLQAVVESSRGFANKDLDKFTEQVRNLAEYWKA